jgi:2-oxoglutarate dehydrogenase E2 component (dihydrolipoamide succinyltransferase)
MQTRKALPVWSATSPDYAGRARDGKLKIEDLQGGTFTITNGGVYGSLFATPILNPPQSGILGMHKIMPDQLP